MNPDDLRTLRADDLLRFLEMSKYTHDSPEAIHALDEVKLYVEAVAGERVGVA